MLCSDFQYFISRFEDLSQVAFNEANDGGTAESKNEKVPQISSGPVQKLYNSRPKMYLY
jgi:hypothetical protein